MLFTSLVMMTGILTIILKEPENAHTATELLSHMVQHTASGIKIRLIRINNYNCLYHDIFLEI